MAFEKIASSPADGKTHAASTVRAGFSGLVNAKRSERSAAGSPIDLGPSTWSDMPCPFFDLALAHQIAREHRHAGHCERAAACSRNAPAARNSSVIEGPAKPYAG